jgi:hypothetical protein
MNHTEFAVSRYGNRNGVTSWRVTGWLHGVRIRKNLKTREEAASEKAALELKAIQATSGIRSASTLLADAQLREAEDAFRQIEGRHSFIVGASCLTAGSADRGG